MTRMQRRARYDDPIANRADAMRILITGGSGFVGQRLCEQLDADGHELLVVSRSPEDAAEVLPGSADIRSKIADFVDAEPEAIVNLAGEPIAEGRWTEAKKRRIVESRVHTTREVVELCGKVETPPRVLVSASAVGYYGDQGDRDVTEDTERHEEWLSDICVKWEAEANKAAEHGVRVAIVRIGLVMDEDGGMLAKMLPAFKFGLGSKLGDGSQYMPWIHRDDLVRIIDFLLRNDGCEGPFNGSAPNPVTNAEFTKKLAGHLNRPTFLPAPAPALKLAFGEMSRMLLTGAKMLPKRITDAGFEFRYPTLDDALDEILD
jgi:hypothetical protein